MLTWQVQQMSSMHTLEVLFGSFHTTWQLFHEEHWWQDTETIIHIQLNLNYLDLNYPDYSVIQTFFSGPNFFHEY